MKNNDYFYGKIISKELTKPEIKKYFQQFKDGNMNARDYIIKCNIGLVIYIVSKKYCNTLFEKNDLVSVGLIGLIKSVDSFEYNKNFEFAIYATRCINNEILMFLRNTKKINRNISLNANVYNTKEKEDTTFENFIEDLNTNIVLDYERKELKNKIRNIVKNLTYPYNIIINMYFGFYNDKTYTQKEIEEKIGIDQTYISRKIKNILNEIRKELYKQEYIEKDQIKKLLK